MRLLHAVVALLAVASYETSDIIDGEFEAWKLEFGRVYNSTSEEDQRKEVWIKNRELVLEHNLLADKGNESYHLGMTKFADMDNEEYKSLIARGCFLPFNASLPRQGSTFLGVPEGFSPPTSVDWRTQGYVTRVKDQGNCDSCWAFSATGSLEGQHFKKTGTLVSLSEQQLVDCSGTHGNLGCNGGRMDYSFNYFKDVGGSNTETSYPYTAQVGLCRFATAQIGAKCTGYVDMPKGDENALMQAVATIGPISVAVDSSQPSFQLYKYGIYDEPLCSSTNLDHAMLVVGYGTENGLDYWLVKNSQGIGWGDHGYIKMIRNKHNQCGIATFASYPLV